MKSRVQAGFTLIELMITIAIIGILAGIAIPGYQSYMRKAVVVQAVAVANGLKTKAIEFHSINGRWATHAESLVVLGISKSSEMASGDVKQAFFDNRNNAGQVYVRVDGPAIGVKKGSQWLRVWMTYSGGMYKTDRCNAGGSHPTDAGVRKYLDC